MPNTGKALTNVSFRSKILAVIDKLKDQDKTVLVRHVDDFEALNKDTFEAGMSALVDAIPAGGGGGGGGDAGYVVKFTMDLSSQDFNISCNKEIDDIINHAEAGDHISAILTFVNVPLPEAPPEISFDLYLDNLKFDYQKMKTTSPDYESMVPTYTYLGFVGDFSNANVLGEGEPSTNLGPDYYKNYVVISWMFDEETPYWNIDVKDVEQKQEDVSSSHLTMTASDGYQSRSWGEKIEIVLKSAPDADGGNAETYKTGTGRSVRFEQSILNMFMDLDLKEYSGGNSYERTVLYSPNVDFANGNSSRLYAKPAQIEVHVDGYAVQTGLKLDGIFTIDECSVDHNGRDSYNITNGFIRMHLDAFDDVNNVLVKHVVTIDVHGLPGDAPIQRTVYKRLSIPYTEL